MYKLIDGKKLAADMRAQLKADVAEFKKEIGLAVVLAGDNPASQVYVRNKVKACEEVGIKSYAYYLPAETTQCELDELLKGLADNGDIHGILVQLPLPGQIDEKKVIQAIDAKKDVDGFHPMNAGALCTGERGFVSCTPAGIIQLLKRSRIAIAGK